jgi:hypothetical protein
MHKSGAKGLDGLEILLKIFGIIWYSQSFVASLVFLFDYDSFRYAYSAFHGYFGIWALLVFWLLEFGMYVAYWLYNLLNIVALVTYWSGTAGWLKEMK